MCVPNKWETAFVIQKIYVQTNVRVLFNLSIINTYYTLKYFYYEFCRNFRQRCFLNGCSLVYLANYIKFLPTAAFEFINYKFHKNFHEECSIVYVLLIII